MRLFRRKFGLILLLGFSFPALAKLPPQSSAQSFVKPSEHSQAQPPQQSRMQATYPQQSQSASQPPAETTEAAGDSTLNSAARELARKVAALLGPAMHQAKFSVDTNPVNLSSVSVIDFQQGWNAFRDELEQLSKAPAPQTSSAPVAPSTATTPATANAAATPPAVAAPPPPARVSVTLSENLADYLWVAEVSQGSEKQALFVSVSRALVSAAAPAVTSIVLQKEFILSSPDAILDFAIIPSSAGATKRLLVLQPERVALFAQTNGAWQMRSQAPIPHANPWPRDLRGLLALTGDSAQAMLPGVVCNITLASNMAAACDSGNSGWPLAPGFLRAFTLLPITTGEGNLFTFVPLGAQDFDSLAVIAAPATSGGPAPVIGTTPEGRALLFDGSSTPVASFSGWGSDVAALYSASRDRWPLLVAGPGDWTAPDTIQAFEIVDNQAIPASGAVNFDGPVTALWSKGEDAAAAISRNLKTGMYEAYLIQATYTQ
jgi:hypothetical protein